ncbi:MAG: stage IV sporulation protein A [Lachnospiraceae bacterium]|nr:stage IV sporulation protein A [Lachnospiraceae bacterium]
MDSFHVYKDIQARTNGEIYIGVVGPVRTGKSTFIRRFMELTGLNQVDEKERGEIRDQLPVSGSGKMVTTVEPKFVPKHGMEIKLADDIKAKIKLIDCVGFMIRGAEGDMENGRERMIKTPWFEREIPFHEGAKIGTQKVIRDHATLGLMITSDGTFGEIPREAFLQAEEKTVEELKTVGKPFLILVNSQRPYQEETRKLTKELEEKYNVPAISVNCEQLRQEDILKILEGLLYEFPVSQLEFYIPKWAELLPTDHYLKSHMLEQIRGLISNIHYIRDVTRDSVQMQSDYIRETALSNVDLATGVVALRMELDDRYYYEMLSEMSGVPIQGEYDLVHTVKELSKMKDEYVKVQSAMESVRGKGYGVVMPELDEITLGDPVLIKQGNKFGVQMKAKSPSIHMIRANIETEIAPIVGSEDQAKDLIHYISDAKSGEEGIWKTNIFGKSIEQLISDGIQTKISQISDESQQKLQDSMQKIVNDSKGGMVCIII